jgi:hypothetical protein
MLKALKDFVWTSEKLSAKSIQDLELIRKRALEKSNNELVALCDAEIARQKPPKKISSAPDKPIKGIHLVCQSERGVVRNSDGTFWSGTWVVAKEHAEAGVVNGIYVALHEKHSEPSYLQGLLKAWEPAVRQAIDPNEEIQTEWGIKFLLEPVLTPFPWRGDGIVERSYWYGDDEGGHFSVGEAITGPELFAKIQELAPSSADGFVTYGDVWTSLRPEIPWGLTAKNEIGHAMGRLTNYCAVNNLPIMSVLLVNAKDRAMTDKAAENIFQACKVLGLDVGSDSKAFIKTQIGNARSFLDRLPEEAA